MGRGFRAGVFGVTMASRPGVCGVTEGLLGWGLWGNWLVAQGRKGPQAASREAGGCLACFVPLGQGRAAQVHRSSEG